MAAAREDHPQQHSDDFRTEVANGREGSMEQPPGVASAESCSELVPTRGNTQRKDKGRLHAVRHGALARHPLEALRYLGEDLKKLRRLERQFRTELRPQGTIADFIFDRFWSSYLRCLLAARAEATAFLPPDRDTRKAAPTPKLLEADQPTLVIDDEQVNFHQALTPDVLRHLALVQRYDAHFSREMYRALGLLLVLRANGESGIEESITAILGIGKLQ